MITQTEKTQAATTPEQALEYLRAGNERFADNRRAERNLLEQVEITSKGQYPYATILSCIDSRASAELIFDQGLGDIFSIRVAGNVINEDVLGSMEFACANAGSKLLVVLGHTDCGAVKGACDTVVQSDNLTAPSEEFRRDNLKALLEKIHEAVNLETQTVDVRTSKNREFVDNVARLHVKRVVQDVVEQSGALRELIKNKKIALTGALYNVEDGTVDFMRETWLHGEIKQFYRNADGGSAADV